MPEGLLIGIARTTLRGALERACLSVTCVRSICISIGPTFALLLLLPLTLMHHTAYAQIPHLADTAPLPDSSVEDVTPSVKQTEIADRSDAELTQLSARWGELSPGERRQLLAEVRKRMASKRRSRSVAEQQNRPRTRPPMVVERRYGRIVRQKDGSVVMQTRVVRRRSSADGLAGQTASQQAANTQPAVQQASPERSQPQKPSGRITFGFGFERRSREAPQPVDRRARLTMKAANSSIDSSPVSSVVDSSVAEPTEAAVSAGTDASAPLATD